MYRSHLSDYLCSLYYLFKISLYDLTLIVSKVAHYCINVFVTNKLYYVYLIGRISSTLNKFYRLAIQIQHTFCDVFAELPKFYSTLFFPCKEIISCVWVILLINFHVSSIIIMVQQSGSSFIFQDMCPFTC